MGSLLNFGRLTKDYDMTSRQLRQKAGYLGRKMILHIDFFLNFFAEGVLYFQKSCAQIKLEILFVILFLSLIL